MRARTTCANAQLPSVSTKYRGRLSITRGGCQSLRVSRQGDRGCSALRQRRKRFRPGSRSPILVRADKKLVDGVGPTGSEGTTESIEHELLLNPHTAIQQSAQRACQECVPTKREIALHQFRCSGESAIVRGASET